MGGSSCTTGDPYWSTARNANSQVICLLDGEEGVNADRGALKFALTAVGAPTNSATTPVAQAFSPVFNGTADGYKVGTDANWMAGGVVDLLGTANKDWEFEAKIKVASFATGNCCIAATRSNSGTNQGGVEFLVITDGRVYVAYYSGSSATDLAVSPLGTIVAGTAYDVRGWKQGGNIGIDVNGVNLQTTAIVNVWSSSPANRGLRIGCREVATGGGSFDAFFNGRIELRVTTHPLGGGMRYAPPYTPPASWIAG